jgi:hypothetical protein
MGLSKKEQIRIMEAQLANFDTLIEKMSYMSRWFDIDPDFHKEARDIVRSNISKTLS